MSDVPNVLHLVPGDDATDLHRLPVLFEAIKAPVRSCNSNTRPVKALGTPYWT